VLWYLHNLCNLSNTRYLHNSYLKQLCIYPFLKLFHNLCNRQSRHYLHNRPCVKWLLVAAPVISGSGSLVERGAAICRWNCGSNPGMGVFLFHDSSSKIVQPKHNSLFTQIVQTLKWALFAQARRRESSCHVGVGRLCKHRFMAKLHELWNA